MRISIIGLKFAGKTTFFDLLTARGMAGSASGKKGATISTVAVPDPRLDRLSEAYQPKKTVAANLEFIDTTALSTEGKGKSFTGGTLEEVKRGDALCLIVREFESAAAPHPETRVDGVRDLEFILNEFVMTDYLLVGKRVERLEKQVAMTKKLEEQHELDALRKVLAILEQEKPARDAGLTAQERKAISSCQLLTLKPLLVVVNVGEAQIPQMETRIAAYAQRFPQHTVTAMCAPIEQDLAGMAPADAAEFMKDLELKDPAFDRIIRGCFAMLDLKVFFTVGDDECRAWPVSRTATAFDCAGAIHSDLQRGFIRAVVLPYADFAAAPTPDTFKHKARQEKREYAVQDGDLIEIRFNV